MPLESILQLACQEADKQGLPLTFRRLEAEELAEESAYDLVFARYLLSHLPRPQRAIEAMVRARYGIARLVRETPKHTGPVCFVTKLLPSCYPSVTVRLQNGNQ